MLFPHRFRLVDWKVQGKHCELKKHRLNYLHVVCYIRFPIFKAKVEQSH